MTAELASMEREAQLRTLEAQRDKDQRQVTQHSSTISRGTDLLGCPYMDVSTRFCKDLMLRKEALVVLM